LDTESWIRDEDGDEEDASFGGEKYAKSGSEVELNRSAPPVPRFGKDSEALVSYAVPAL